jgi:hypothetical protein
MIISWGRSYIFVHAPKTGGTSMALALEDRAMKDDIMLGDTPKALNRRRKMKGVKAAGRLWKHSTLADIDGIVLPHHVERMFTFTLVRNPWDRMVSYYHWLREQTFDHSAVTLAKSVDFDDFLRDAVTQKSQTASPAASYMRDVNGVEQCNAYIRLEHFASDVVPLVEHLGFDLALPHENASKRDAAYQDYYNDETRQIVAACCAEDIARFGYAFD